MLPFLSLSVLFFFLDTIFSAAEVPPNVLNHVILWLLLVEHQTRLRQGTRTLSLLIFSVFFSRNWSYSYSGGKASSQRLCDQESESIYHNIIHIVYTVNTNILVFGISFITLQYIWPWQGNLHQMRGECMSFKRKKKRRRNQNDLAVRAQSTLQRSATTKHHTLPVTQYSGTTMQNVLCFNWRKHRDNLCPAWWDTKYQGHSPWRTPNM